MNLSREMDPEQAKRDARKRLLALRRAMPADDRRAAEAAMDARLRPIWQALAAHVAPRRAVLAVYWPIRGEPDLRRFYPSWRELGLTLALPVTPARPGPLTFACWPPQARLQADAFGIATPQDQPDVLPDALLAPCVGFAAGAWRLGHGGGYFDRTLAACDLPAVGLAFDDCEWPQYPVLAHDRPMSWIVTERRVLPGRGPEAPWGPSQPAGG